MADTKREIERKYEATTTDTESEPRLPDFTKVAGVSSVQDRGVVDLDAVYYDTDELALAAHGITLRRRTGGDDAGWHLKLPVAPNVRDEIRAPLTDTDGVPRALSALVRARTLGEPLLATVRLRSSRRVWHLRDKAGELLAEASVDTVTAHRLGGRDAQAPLPEGARTSFTEIEIELADDGDPAFLDAVDKKLRKAGVRPSASPSKLARALAETGGGPVPRPVREDDTAGAHVLAYLRDQVEAMAVYDPAVRRDLPDSVHQLRVATRRMRSAFKTYRKVLDRTVTDPLGDELKWLAGELGVDRDQEVLADRLLTRLSALPRTLLLGPVRGRLRIWSVARRSGSRRRTLAVLDGRRYLELLRSLDAFLAAPPLRPAADRDAVTVLHKALVKDHARLADRTEHALALPPGGERDLALHEARKAAKRLRYAAESARPALGKSANKLRKRVKDVQGVLGDHQDSVVARAELRNLAIQAHAAGEPSFAWGLLYGQEEACAADRERELPEVWRRVPGV
ncbi:CHAD domain-containing protein [Streptomyces spiroverticillatus]|uniref:CHAD domain-containing protein n=1 Tax=Streptomyces finlayi TaxID=67296 RepID=A0A919CAF1_9ACTN|nr:CYTH and CHAD domain-containing protein [Streptomyces finlayi]GHA12181.1 CHAD domain-containing protein [Streptomyces spiroverticillatus]GHC94531.1 CHAD domain-containing protein [Streptomyces finlayi]